MDELNTLIDLLIKEKGGTREQYLSLMNKIAHHESKGDSTIKQIGGGPGRGLFQFEEGEFAGAKTAANRTIQYYNQLKKPLPKWLKETQGNKSIDASKLTPEQQHVLFLGNMRKHPKANFTNVWEGNETVEDFWVNYHWAGKKSDELSRRKSFKRSLKAFEDGNTTQAVMKPIKYMEPYPEKVKDATYVKPIQVPKIQKAPEFNLDNIDLTQSSVNNEISYSDKFEEYNQRNIAAYGGIINSMSTTENSKFNEFNNGGTHEENPNGGIPQGMGNNGKMNTVEEDETSYNFKDKGKYIFSNRIKL